MKVRTKRRICVLVGALALAFACGVVGGMERFNVDIGKGILEIAVSLLVSAGAFYKSGVMR